MNSLSVSIATTAYFVNAASGARADEGVATRGGSRGDIGRHQRQLLFSAHSHFSGVPFASRVSGAASRWRPPVHASGGRSSWRPRSELASPRIAPVTGSSATATRAVPLDVAAEEEHPRRARDLDLARPSRSRRCARRARRPRPREDHRPRDARGDRPAVHRESLARRERRERGREPRVECEELALAAVGRAVEGSRTGWRRGGRRALGQRPARRPEGGRQEDDSHSDSAEDLHTESLRSVDSSLLIHIPCHAGRCEERRRDEPFAASGTGAAPRKARKLTPGLRPRDRNCQAVTLVRQRSSRATARPTAAPIYFRRDRPRSRRRLGFGPRREGAARARDGPRGREPALEDEVKRLTYRVAELEAGRVALRNRTEEAEAYVAAVKGVAAVARHPVAARPRGPEVVSDDAELERLRKEADGAARPRARALGRPRAGGRRAAASTRRSPSRAAGDADPSRRSGSSTGTRRSR